MEKKVIKKSFERSSSTYEEYAMAQAQIVTTLLSTIVRYMPEIPRKILEIGCGTGLLSRKLFTAYPHSCYFLNDLNDKIETVLSLHSSGNSCIFISGDAEKIELPTGMDLIVSSSTFQWFENLPVFFEKAYNLLNPGGYLFFSTFGRSNLTEIKQLEHKGLDYFSLDELQEMLKKYNVDILCAEEEQFQLYFESPLDVLKHLKNTGVNGGFSSVWTPQKMRTFIAAYEEQYSSTLGVQLTYHPIYMAVKKQKL